MEGNMKFSKGYNRLIFLFLVGSLGACSSHTHEAVTPIAKPIDYSTVCESQGVQDEKVIVGCEILAAIATDKWKIETTETGKAFKKGDRFSFYTGKIQNPLTKSQSVDLAYIQHKKPWYKVFRNERFISVIPRCSFKSEKVIVDPILEECSIRKVTVDYDNGARGSATEGVSVSVFANFYSLGNDFHIHPVVFEFTKKKGGGDTFHVEYEVSEIAYSLFNRIDLKSHLDSGTGTGQ